MIMRLFLFYSCEPSLYSRKCFIDRERRKPAPAPLLFWPSQKASGGCLAVALVSSPCPPLLSASLRMFTSQETRLRASSCAPPSPLPFWFWFSVLPTKVPPPSLPNNKRNLPVCVVCFFRCCECVSGHHDVLKITVRKRLQTEKCFWCSHTRICLLFRSRFCV